MAKTPFTEGPYYVAADDAPDCPPHRNSGLALVDTGRSGDWPIARLCEWQNARAIAAIPDLYAELRDRSNALGGVKILLLQGDIEGAMEILNRYELKFTDGPTMHSAALAKARGE